MKSEIPLNIVPTIKTNKTTIKDSKKCSIYNAFVDDLSLYIHFPFCIAKCPFCPIKTYKYNSEMVNAYVASLIKEISNCLSVIGYCKVNSVHFGGGTPSLMKNRQIESILAVIRNHVNIDDAEILIEAHPEFITADTIDYWSRLKNCTINFGVQSFDNEILYLMKRHCNNLDILQKVNLAKEKGVTVGIDYICDWPNSSQKRLDYDTKCLEDLQPEHISQYPLCWTADLNKFWSLNLNKENLKKRGELNRLCEERLLSLGYCRYSTFHYQKENTFSHRYGRNQLNGGRWIGFGAGAYTYLGNMLYVNSHITEYIGGNLALEPVMFNYTERLIWELAFLIRNRPVYKKDIVAKYGAISIKLLETIIANLINKQYIISEQDLSLTWEGIINIKGVEETINDAFLE